MNQIDPQLKKDFSEAQELTGEEKYHESIEKYELILKKYPNLLTAINNIGLNYEYLGLLDKSIYYGTISFLFLFGLFIIINCAVIKLQKKKFF